MSGYRHNHKRKRLSPVAVAQTVAEGESAPEISPALHRPRWHLCSPTSWPVPDPWAVVPRAPPLSSPRLSRRTPTAGPPSPQQPDQATAYGTGDAAEKICFTFPIRDLFLLTSISEGIPVTLIEAMGARLPVVSTAVGGIKEVVRPEQTGFVAPAGDDTALAAAVVRLLIDPERAKTWGAAGRKRAEQLFSEDEMHTRYVRLYEEMLPRGVLQAVRS